MNACESGVGAAILAQKKGYEVFLSDGGDITEVRKEQLRENNIHFEEGQHTQDKILNSNLVVKSPGIPDSTDIVKRILAQKIQVISEIEWAYRFMGDAKIIAITGTNGKTTTSLLTYHLLKSNGLNVALGGNVGTSLAKLVAEGEYDYYVVEVSSFQLDGIVDFKPDIAILLNITPDHLDRYDYKFENYVSSKFRIIENLTQEEAFIYCADSVPITEELSRSKAEYCVFAMSASKHEKLGAYLEEDHLIFNYEYKEKDQHHNIPVSEISLIGKHNMVNSMAAVLSAIHLDLPIHKILNGLKTFKNAPHRLEYVDDIEGVGYINDSKATNVDSVYYALDGIKQGIIWIAGGIDKGNDYKQLEDLVDGKVKGLICMGTDNSGLVSFFDNKVKKLAEVDSMKGALEQAYEWAKTGDVVLLSPACSSFDLFDNYEDRGDKFKSEVKKLSRVLKAEKP
jgi:UDP-N-acetylmuramoylalanine--D-glutamate ligase